MDRILFAPLACCVLLLAGCTSSTTTTTTASGASGHELREHFDTMQAGPAPQGWTPSADSTWKVESASGGPGNVVRGVGTQARNWLLAPAGDFGNMDLNVKIDVLTRTEPGGAGVVIHFQDATHYVIIRFSPAEAAWHLFVANGGDPSKKGEATHDPAKLPALNEWTTLKVSVAGHHIQAWQGTELVIDYDDGGNAPAAGQAGLFTRGATEALFDDFEVHP
jgi:hypothetical protein